MTEWQHLVLFDGECGLCDRTVQWLLAHDKKGALTFAPLQGALARRFVPPGDYDTIVLVERDASGTHVYERSRAFFRIGAALGGIWSALSLLRVLPAFLTDLPYRFVANNRLRWFGKVACRVPTPDVRARFLG